MHNEMAADGGPAQQHRNAHVGTVGERDLG